MARAQGGGDGVVLVGERLAYTSRMDTHVIMSFANCLTCSNSSAAGVTRLAEARKLTEFTATSACSAGKRPRDFGLSPVSCVSCSVGAGFRVS